MIHVRNDIAAMQGYVPGEQPQAGKFIKLNTNENPYSCSPAVHQALARASESGLERYPDPLATAFRTRAAEILGVEPDWILCGNGSDDILTIVTRAFVGQGQRLRFPYPSYILYRTLAEIQGARFETAAFTESWGLPDPWPKPKANLTFVSNPNSPSGTLVPPGELLRLAEGLDGPLVVDEAYVDFADTTALELATQPDVIVTRSFSKSYALAGLRFGFAVAAPALVHELMKAKDSYNCDALSLAGAAAALEDRAWFDETHARILATRARMTDRLTQLGFDVCPSQANFVWCRRDDKPVKPIFEALKQRGVFVRYMNYEGYGDGLRITVGTDEEVDRLFSNLSEIG